MKAIFRLLLIISVIPVSAQDFDYYGPQPFGEILNNSFNFLGTPSSISSIDNKKYVVILDAETKSKLIRIGSDPIGAITMEVSDFDQSATYGSLLRSIFQIVDINTHADNNDIPLAGNYRLNPFLHSYYAMNSDDDYNLICADGGSMFVEESTNGYVLISFAGSPEAAEIKAISRWEYESTSGSFVEDNEWTDRWLKFSGTSLEWTANDQESSVFYLADANAYIDLEIEDGSDFNPLDITYQPNATAAIPDDVTAIEDSRIFTDLERKLDESYISQLGDGAGASTAAEVKLDEIEETLNNNQFALRYPKGFYLALRESMLSQKIASTDIYGGRLDYNTVPSVYFTNALDDNGSPHPFMAIASHAVSTRPNQLVDVNRPPGAEQGVGYGESTVTRNGKLGEFLMLIPLRDYGLVDDLFDNDLSSFGDLASDFDDKHSTTTVKDVYNYTSLVSIGVAIDGVTIYPAQNNNLRFAVEDAEVTHSGIHVGGGLEVHYHADGHGYNGNGINLYNYYDYIGKDHPPIIGMAYDGIALFGKYEPNYPMTGDDKPLDEFGGHDHGDDFGYHYHAHSQQVVGSTDGTSFTENFLLVGAWKGSINDIPPFLELKTNIFENQSLARYAGATYTPGNSIILSNTIINSELVYPNPSNGQFQLNTPLILSFKLYSLNGQLIEQLDADGNNTFTITDSVPDGIYLLKGQNQSESFSTKIVLDRK
ncbi:MAG: T9SS type A sorting domain-containing protein [Marinoscillum sp.]